MSASLRRIWIQLTADRKRFGVLCATCGVGLLLWARLIIVSNVSRTAIADGGQPVVASSAAIGGANKGPSGVGGAADKPVGQNGDKSSSGAPKTVEVRLWSRSERDPFVISRQHFPKASALPEVNQEAGKLPTEPAEDSTQIEARRVARVREVLGTLKLEAAIGTSSAIINGESYRVGDSLPPMGSERMVFTLAEVRQRTVVLDHMGRRFEVEMSRPGSPIAGGKAGN